MRALLYLVLFVLPFAPALGQTEKGSIMVQQQPYSRVQQKADVLIKDIGEKKTEVISVGIAKQGKDIVVNTTDTPLRVTNSEDLSKFAQRIPYEYEIEVDDAAEGTVNLKAQQLTAVKKWQETDFATKDDFTALENAYQALDQSALSIVRPEATAVDAQRFSRVLDRTKQELVAAYQRTIDTGADNDSQRQIIQNYQELERTGKALYGIARDDRYPPEAYQRIYANSRGSLALLSGSGDVHCSGVLIADEYALTNQHCTDGFFPNDLKVRFDYEERIDGSTLPTRTLNVVEKLPFTTAEREGLDFAVLKLGDDGPDGNKAGDLYPVQCLSSSRVRRNDPLYLVGHPLGDPRTVHDNTFVYFPFRVTETEFFELEMAVRSEFLGADDEAARLAEFRESYKMRDENGMSVYENFSQRWQLQPTIGVDSDTFHGNSGSPAYSRKTHDVVGILFDGEDDLDEPWQVGWRSHEAILPIEMIVGRLDAVHPQWRNWEGVCINE